MSGYTMTQPELFYNLATAVTKNTYTSQAVISAIGSTSVPRCMIPAGYLLVGKGIHIEANGTIAATGTPTFTFAAGLDSTPATIAGTGGGTIVTSSALTMSAATFAWTFECDLVCQAAGNLGTTIQANGEINVSAAASGTFTTGRNSSMFATSMTGINNEINLWLELFGTWSVSNAANTTTLQQLKVYLEN